VAERAGIENIRKLMVRSDKSIKLVLNVNSSAALRGSFEKGLLEMQDPEIRGAYLTELNRLLRPDPL
jgi:hypothetical protein